MKIDITIISAPSYLMNGTPVIAAGEHTIITGRRWSPYYQEWVYKTDAHYFWSWAKELQVIEKAIRLPKAS